MSLIQDEKTDYSICKTTERNFIVFLDEKNKEGGFFKAEFSVQKINDSEDGHYFGLNYELVTELFNTKHCIVGYLKGKPISLLKTEELKYYFDIKNEPFYTLNLDIEKSLDLFLDEKGIDFVLSLFDTTTPYETIVSALLEWTASKQ